MANIKVEVEVSKEGYELGQGAVNLLGAIKEVTSDGFQVGQDLPHLVTVAFGQMAAIEGIEKVKDEFKNDPAAFLKGVAMSLADGYAVLKGKKAIEEPKA